MRKAVFLDKDGTIINNIPYNINLKNISIQPETIRGLRMLQENGYALIIVTNQSGVTKGYFSEYDFLVHLQTILDLFLQKGIFITSYYYCPHDREQTSYGLLRTCFCGKPSPGMILQAATDFSIDLRKSWMIGDILNDMQAGNTAGVTTILIDNGNETEWVLTPYRQPKYIAANLYDAANIIYGNEYKNIQYGQQ